MKRLAALVLFLLPVSVAAAALGSASELAGTVLYEQRPVAFTVKAVHHGGTVTTVNVQGQKEGVGPSKAWAHVWVKWTGGGQWMHTEADIRVKDGKAYFRIASASGSPGVEDLAAFRQAAGTWYMLDPTDRGVQAWFAPNLNPNAAAALLSVTSKKFPSGYSYTFAPVVSDDSIRASIAEALPTLIAPEASAPLKAKVDTNLSNEFQYASLSFGSTFLFKAQRQFHGVYVEVPETSPALPNGPVRDLFFSMFGTPDVMESVFVEPPVQELSLEPIDAPTVIPVSASTRSARAAARLARQRSERVVAHLHGSLGVDERLTVRLASTPVQWNSALEFSDDIGSGKGVLYRYDTPVDVRFSSRGAFAGLEVIFFDQAGRYISSASMPYCSKDPCATYEPDRPAMYALETEIGFIGRTKIGPLWRLSLDWTAAQTPGVATQQFDRRSARVLENHLTIPAPTYARPVELTVGDQSLRILAESIATSLRVSDISAASGSDGSNEAVYRLYETLFGTVRKNGLSYAFIVVPTKQENTFTLLVDNFSFASNETLDLNGNGRIDPAEKPASRGSTYFYSPFTDALSGPRFDGSGDGGLAVYVPVKNADGQTVAVLALVR